MESIEKATRGDDAAGSHDVSHDDSGDDNEDEAIDDGWASIPTEETLPVTRAAPFLEFLLDE
jgi:hypothetical protein